MAEILLGQWELFLPPAALGCKPAQLASFLPELLRNIGSANIVREHLSSSGDSHEPETSTQALPPFWMKGSRSRREGPKCFFSGKGRGI